MSPLYHTHQSPPETSGIYRIICTVNDRFYIGSAINLRNRWRHHCNDLKNNVHCNQHLQHAWNKYGPDVFTFEIIEFVLPFALIIREQFWFDKLHPFGNRGFNIVPNAGSSLGYKHTEEAKRKVGDSKRGKPSPNRGKPASPEARAKVGAANRGRSPSQETRKKLRAAMLGNTHLLGYKPSKETLHKISERLKDKPRPPEIREKIGSTQRKTYIVIDPDGNEYTIRGLAKFCREHGLDQGSMSCVAQGKREHHKGWKIRYIDEPRQGNLGRKNGPDAIARMVDSHANEMKTVILIDPYGVEHTITGLHQFCREYSLDRRSIQRVIQGKFKHHKGWRLPNK